MNPFLKPIRQNVQQTDILKGYNHNLRIQDGEFYDMENMSSDLSPVLSPRGPRGLFKEGKDIQAVAIKGVSQGPGPDTIPVYLQDNAIHVGDEVFPIDGLNPGEKRLIVMGSKLIVFPDRKYIDLQDEEVISKSLDAQYALNGTGGKAQFTPCDLSGKEIIISYTSAETPASPKDKEYWVDPGSDGGGKTLKRYSAATGFWMSIVTPYVKITSTGIGKKFKKFDGVRINSFILEPDTGNAYNIIWELSDDWIVVVGLIDGPQTSTYLAVSRFAPNVDYVFLSDNRLWGCEFTGLGTNKDIGFVNRIYASCPGDPTNWSRFMGQADDSYFAEVGIDGPFTGGVDFKGQPLFFKENAIIKVFGKYPPYTTQVVYARGVQQGCDRSLAYANESLYYKTRDGICTYDGSLPRLISMPLGTENYQNAIGAARSGKYYISMQNEVTGEFNLFVFDAQKGIWCKEDSFKAADIVSGSRHIYALEQNTDRMQTDRIVALDGDMSDPILQMYEPNIHWKVVTGDLALENPRQKYISRITIRMEIDACSQVEFYVRYDGAREWSFICAQRGSRLQSLTVPIRPRRCDHMQVLIKGIGPAKIYGFTKTIQEGSDFT